MNLPITEGAVLLPGFAAAMGADVMAGVQAVIQQAPFRHMTVPGGHKMSVAMSNCGRAGWVSDGNGYRYDARDPETGRPWPPMQPCFFDLARDAAARAGYPDFTPDACLINCYAQGARMSLHQDRDEQDFTAPIVSVSLGAAAIFLFGGLKRGGKPRRIRLEHGDVVVWGGPARLAYHGIAPLRQGDTRYNLTFRKAL
ncbi:MAG: DNA oxidative demethylase AlkB [Alphaproteobacteria bacterium]|nr:DNA oxidative demethylase AlkB [Alphaproteobacteria bacterium]